MFKTILVAIDASDYSRQVVPAAIEVARKFQSQVVVLHVSEHDSGRKVVYTTETPAEASSLVGRAVKAFRDGGIQVNGLLHDVAMGHTARKIAETATEVDADLIVMGSRGLSDVQGILVGSVTHKVMQLTQTSVLVARGPVRVKEPVVRPAPAKAAPAPVY